MTYLLTQILLCLALAMVAGAAIGWLLNGHRGARREHKIREELIRQSLALNQAETDNKMIEDDYRELKFRSEESLALLKEENRQIPVLNQNLDKSQTLVRQMLQKHEAEQRQLATENNLLATKLKELENRERAVAKLQMELNTERLNRKMSSNESKENNSPDSSATNTGSDDDRPVISPNLLSAAAAPTPTSVDDAISSKSTSIKEEQTAQQTEMPLDTQGVQVESTASLSSELIAQAISELETVNEEAKPGILTAIDIEPETSAELITEDAAETSSVDDDADNNSKTYDFGQSDQDDNLQEIFGIGPVAEKTLRKLGITSFEQLASLEREHIEHIANVLEIFPGRIERDDWVGGARKRVEQANTSTTHESDLPELEDA